jgi:hypothetical protein
MHVAGQTWGKLTCRWRVGPVLKIEEAGIDQNRKLRRTYTQNVEFISKLAIGSWAVA